MLNLTSKRVYALAKEQEKDFLNLPKSKSDSDNKKIQAFKLVSLRRVKTGLMRLTGLFGRCTGTR